MQDVVTEDVHVALLIGSAHDNVPQSCVLVEVGVVRHAASNAYQQYMLDITECT